MVGECNRPSPSDVGRVVRVNRPQGREKFSLPQLMIEERAFTAAFALAHAAVTKSGQLDCGQLNRRKISIHRAGNSFVDGQSKEDVIVRLRGRCKASQG